MWTDSVVIEEGLTSTSIYQWNFSDASISPWRSSGSDRIRVKAERVGGYVCGLVGVEGSPFFSPALLMLNRSASYDALLFHIKRRVGTKAV